MAQTTPPTLTAPGAAPDPNDRVTFDSRSYAQTTWFSTMITEMTAALQNVYNNAVDAFNSATSAASNAVASASSATLSQDWATKSLTPVSGGEYSAKYHAQAAAVSASTALNAPGTSATSTTSLAVGVGSRSLTIQAGKQFVVGQFVVIASTVSPQNCMIGQITAHAGEVGVLTAAIDVVRGGGIFADWTISLTSATLEPPRVDLSLINLGVI